mmetsp:Transcript_1494/g.3518  ORF Transcript_1494/g.3518 Transcript_1494/m.3518 type:complete len:108 (-) Transcript_1494:61-384(-)
MTQEWKLSSETVTPQKETTFSTENHIMQTRCELHKEISGRSTHKEVAKQKQTQEEKVTFPTRKPTKHIEREREEPDERVKSCGLKNDHKKQHTTRHARVHCTTNENG